LPLDIELQDSASGLSLPPACVLGPPDAPYVWLHALPERFERRPLRVLERRADAVIVQADLHADDRVVQNGAALLAQYR
jgi:hypothetical protein